MSNGPFRGVSSLFAAAAAVNLPIQANTAVPTSARHTAIEMNSAEADQLGLSASYTAITTVEAASAAIAALHEQLDEIPISEKVAYMCAKQTKPELVDDEEMIKFLLAENFKAPEAARRLVRYWNDRYRLFGQDKFCLPLTLKGALQGDSLALSRGYVQILPRPDTAGRALIYVDWSCHEPSIGYTVDSMHRVFWYIVHVAMEDIQAFKKGMVVLIYPQEARLDQFDHNLWRAISESCHFSLPIRWRATHIVHPNRFFSVIHPLFMTNLPRSLQDRVIVHSGTKMKVLSNLLRYCLPWDRIPSDVGGCVDLDLGVWLTERMVKEERDSSAEASRGGVEQLIAQLQEPSKLTQATSQGAADLGSQKMPSLFQPDQTISEESNGIFVNGAARLLLNIMLPSGNNIPIQASTTTDSAAAGNVKKSAKSKDKSVAKGKTAKGKTAKGKTTNAKSGRKSDPRMDRAVEAKMANPSISLVGALRAGGFDIPAANTVSSAGIAAVDGDNVKITQRKNQLLRRLRTAKSTT